MTSAADAAEKAAKLRREQEVAAVLAALEQAHGIGAGHVHPSRLCSEGTYLLTLVNGM